MRFRFQLHFLQCLLFCKKRESAESYIEMDPVIVLTGSVYYEDDPENEMKYELFCIIVSSL